MASRTPPSEALAAWLPRQRWFAARTRRISGMAVEDAISLAGGALVLAAVQLEGGGTERYVLTLGQDVRGEISEALDDPAFCRALLDLIAGGGRLEGRAGALAGVPTGEPMPARDLPVRRVGAEQSNTSVVVGQVAIMKLFRRLAFGPNPEAEMTRYLTLEAAFGHVPRLLGELEYRTASAEPATLAVTQALVPGATDGWEWTLGELRRFYAAAGGGAPDAGRLRALAETLLGAAHRLGEITGGLHTALGRPTGDPAFRPETITADDLAAWTAAVREQVERARQAAGEALAVPSRLAEGLAALAGCTKIRHHGDLHLGQTLRRADGDFVIIDFEGEPLRPLAERRRKHTPLRDVAGVLRSLHYAAVSAMPAGAEAWAGAWEREASAAFLDGYRAATRGAPFVPGPDRAFRAAVAVFEVEKAAYEVVYEASHRPEWIAIPRAGLLRAAARLEAAAAGAA